MLGDMYMLLANVISVVMWMYLGFVSAPVQGNANKMVPTWCFGRAPNVAGPLYDIALRDF